MAFSPDGAFFVSGGADRKIFLFDGREGTLIAEITDADAHQGSIFSVSWSKDSDRFATSSADQTVKVWSASKRHLIKTWSLGLGTSVPHQQVGVVWTPREDDTIISLSLSGDLTYLTPSSSTPVRVVSGHQKPLTAIELTASGTLYTGSSDGRVCSWTPAGIATIVAGTGHTNVVSSLVETSPDKLASVGWDDTLRTISGSFTGEGTPTGAQPKSAARISSSLLAVLTTTHLSTHTTDGEQTNTHPLASGTALAASASGIIAVSTQDGTLNLFTASLDKLSATPASNRAQISALAFSPDSKYLAAGDAAGLVVLYAVTSEGVVTKVTERWAFHTARVTDLAWNPAGTHVATASLDTGVFVYSVEKPMKNIKERGAHVGGASGVRWVGENEIVSVGDDGAVKKWAVSW